MTDDRVKGTSTASNGAGHDAALVSTPGTGVSARWGRAGVVRHVREFIRTIRDGDNAMVEAAVETRAVDGRCIREVMRNDGQR